MLHGWILLLLSLPPRPSSLRVRAWRRLRGLGAVALKSGGLPPARLAGPLRAVPVARPGDPARRRRGDPAPRRPDREHAAAGRRAPLPGGPRPGLRGPRGSLPQARSRAAAAARRGAGPARARDGSIDRDRLLRGAGTAAGRAGAGSGRSSRRTAGRRAGAARRRRLDLDALQGRRWVTRPRPHVDRIASAWLIKRFWTRRPSSSSRRPTRSRATRSRSTWRAWTSAITARTAPSRPCCTAPGFATASSPSWPRSSTRPTCSDGKFAREEARGIDLVLRGAAAPIKDDQRGARPGPDPVRRPVRHDRRAPMKERRGAFYLIDDLIDDLINKREITHE